MREQLLASIQKDGILPPFPGIINQLREMIEDPNTGMNDVAKVIQSDPVLAGKLVQLANSVFGSGQAFFATNINRALGRLGLKMAMDLAYSLKLPSIFPSHGAFDYVTFWKYSLGLGVVASKLAEVRKLPIEDVSNVYLGGLMRNTGILLFVHLLKDEYIDFLKEQRKMLEESDGGLRAIRHAYQFEAAETKRFGINHVELGSKFIERWWNVDPKVLSYIEARPKLVQDKTEHLIEMARYVLWDAKVDDGVLGLQVTLPDRFLEEKFKIGEDFRNELHAHIKAAFTILR